MIKKSKTYDIGDYIAIVNKDGYPETKEGCEGCGSKCRISTAIGRYTGSDSVGRITRLCTPCSKKYGFFGGKKSMKKGITLLKMKGKI